ncbi:MAG: serine hydroxymethyltransferase [Candidatus Yanofskybacteria bacterium]|nr:serine hydroxymethyltransferase [Candidatus Yanofskybacteria bacterium]
MIKRLIKKEIIRQKKVINLIPSENYVSKNVLAALGSPLTNKYAEGRSHRRYYFGNEVVDRLEDEVKRLVYEVFKISPKKYGVNVQSYSGSIANLASYVGSVGIGGRILAMSLEHGGHLTHGHDVSMTGKLFKFKHYGVGRDGLIDYNEVARSACDFKPQLIVCGATAYPRKLDFKKFRKIANSVGALLMADISHIAGLVVVRVHPSPFSYADIITTTTQKTLRGPRGAIIISKLQVSGDRGQVINLTDQIDKTVFPGLQGGPQMHTIAAIGVCLEEALRPNFKKYAKQIVANAKELATELKRLGFKIITGGTDNHLMLMDVTPLGLTGKQAGERLERAGIIVNKNMIPYDTRKPWDPSGIRLGTPAVTTQCMKEKEMVKIARKIKKILLK